MSAQQIADQVRLIAPTLAWFMARSSVCDIAKATSGR
jgi:hypothetical protein